MCFILLIILTSVRHKNRNYYKTIYVERIISSHIVCFNRHFQKNRYFIIA